MDTSGTIAFCERLFAPWLDGRKLLANMDHLRGSAWINFPRVANSRWVMGNVVLMGQARAGGCDRAGPCLRCARRGCARRTWHL
jgi:anthraniloyl-CoA monooxygenase